MAKNTPLDIDQFVDSTPSNDTDVSQGSFVVDLTVPMVQELLPKGDYNATIVSAKPTVAKSGNPMIELRWRIDGGDFDQRSIFDFLVFTRPTGDWNKDFPLRRIRSLVDTIGTHVLTNGAIDCEKLLGESCVLNVVQVDGKRNGNTINPETGEAYPMQNNVSAYKPAGSLRTVDDLL